MAKILWLTSWYPTPLNPYLGDFIQRHAQAVSVEIPIDLFHISQAGANIKVKKNYSEKKIAGGLCENIEIFSFHPTGWNLIDKLRYNLKYTKTYKKFIKNYIKENGIPLLVHVHVPMKAGIFAKRYCSKWNIPYFVSEQSSHYGLGSPDSYHTKNIFFKSITKSIFKNAAAVTSVSGTVGKMIAEIANLKSVQTIHNLVDSKLFYYQEKKATPKFTWLHASSLSHQKNFEGLLETFAKVIAKNPDQKLIVCGLVNEEQVQLSKILCLQNHVQFLGEVSYEEVAFQMRSADAFVLFSRHENFPCVIVEALCCGLPVISTNVGGVAEAINSENGILIDSEDTLALEEKMIELKKDYFKYDRKKIAFNATSKYDTKVIAKEFVALYKTVGINP